MKTEYNYSIEYYEKGDFLTRYWWRLRLAPTSVDAWGKDVASGFAMNEDRAMKKIRKAIAKHEALLKSNRLNIKEGRLDETGTEIKTQNSAKKTAKAKNS